MRVNVESSHRCDTRDESGSYAQKSFHLPHILLSSIDSANGRGGARRPGGLLGELVRKTERISQEDENVRRPKTTRGAGENELSDS